ncbi:hypothetical protein DM860_012578 [Cuscuta australis]|uniref:UDENN domain-containing protein n=1 Tax=Cuscuta australis TaxID=267555 RepID=A0A328DC67_9ASTE|nr:hypothetical protein DM860_012578 [Cuscuta australis]
MQPREGEWGEELQTPPYQVLQQISEEVVRVTGEALQNITGSFGIPPAASRSRTHRRSHSEVVVTSSSSSSSVLHWGGGGNAYNFQKWKIQMQKALHWGNHFQDDSPSFNPEILADQKRQWYQLHPKAMDYKKYKEPFSLFEHFIIVGLHPEANLKAAEDAFAKKKKWELELEKSHDMVDIRMPSRRAPSLPSLEPQILFKYPPGKKMHMRPDDLAAFCFPGGVKAHVLERTPSLSELNQLVYGQEHLSRDDFSFLFSLKVGDNATLYGVCLQVREIVQRPPAIYGNSSPLCLSPGGSSRFLVSAPRCYCVLTRVPFFELHYEMLNSLIAQERLNRITQVISRRTTLSDFVPYSVTSKLKDTDRDPEDSGWMESAIPVDSAIFLTAAAAGIICDHEVPSCSLRGEVSSPGSMVASDSSDHSPVKQWDMDDGKKLHCFDDCASEASERNNDSSQDNARSLEEEPSNLCLGECALDRPNTSDTLFSTVRAILSEDEDDELCHGHDKDAADFILEWAKENKNELLQIVCSYHSLPLPSWGCNTIFHPLEHLPPIKFKRSSKSDLGVSDEDLAVEMQDLDAIAKVNFDLAAAEEAAALSVWTTAATCRALSLETILTMITGVLLEKQVVLICPNLGVLSALVLSLIPIIRPFQWQSLFLPILPLKMLDLLDAPVPFIVGLQQKPADLRKKISNLIYVNIAKDQVKPCYLPSLPRYKELVSELQPIHARLEHDNSVAQGHPTYRCNDVQAEAATQFLTVMRHYLESLCSNLRTHTITSVQSNNDRVSLLMKDSFIASFPSRDQSFIKLFVDTQLFSVLSDARLSSYED